ncbi:MAG: biopolymer transporter ExbD [Cyanobacteria bacterium P01_F01_bin.53]
MRLPEDTDINRPSVNILPMIDVIFAILAFFILSTLYLTKAEGLPVNLPQAVTATPQNQIDVTLTITQAGDLFLGDEAVVLTELADEVRSLGQATGQTTGQSTDQVPSPPIMVTIRADEVTSHGRVVAAMDQLRTVQNVKLGIATTQP